MTSNQSSVPIFPPGYLEEYNGQAPFSVAIAFIVLEVICVVLRFWARIVGKIAWGADDTLIVIGTMLCLAVSGGCLGGIHYGGIGYHLAVFKSSPSTLVAWAKYTGLIIPMVQIPAVVFPKLAILVLYLRIFTKRTDRIACWIIGALMVANCIGAMTAGLFICIPLNFLWNKTIPGGHCIDINAWYRWSSVMNILTDVMMLILPIPVIWKIQTSKTVKLGLILTIATGSSGLITSIVRLKGFFAHDISVDATWTSSRLITLTIIENGMYLIAACLPTYRLLILLVWRKVPTSWVCFGSRADGSPKSRLSTYETPSDSYQLNGFTQLDKGGKDAHIGVKETSDERCLGAPLEVP